MAEKSVRDRVVDRFNSYPMLSDYFPLMLDNGAVVPNVHGECCRCHKTISGARLRGEVRETVASCYRITAIGWCESCDLLTPHCAHVVPRPDADYAYSQVANTSWPEDGGGRLISFPSRAITTTVASNTA